MIVRAWYYDRKDRSVSKSSSWEQAGQRRISENGQFGHIEEKEFRKRDPRYLIFLTTTVFLRFLVFVVCIYKNNSRLFCIRLKNQTLLYYCNTLIFHLRFLTICFSSPHLQFDRSIMRSKIFEMRALFSDKLLLIVSSR